MNNLIYIFLLIVSNVGAQICAGDQFIETSGADVSFSGPFTIELTDSSLVFSMDQAYQATQYKNGNWATYWIFFPSSKHKIERRRKIGKSTLLLWFNSGSKARIFLNDSGNIRSLWYYEDSCRFYFWTRKATDFFDY